MMQRKEKVRDNIWNPYHHSLFTPQKTHDFHLKFLMTFVLWVYSFCDSFYRIQQQIKPYLPYLRTIL